MRVLHGTSFHCAFYTSVSLVDDLHLTNKWGKSVDLSAYRNNYRFPYLAMELPPTERCRYATNAVDHGEAAGCCFGSGKHTHHRNVPMLIGQDLRCSAWVLFWKICLFKIFGCSYKIL